MHHPAAQNQPAWTDANLEADLQLQPAASGAPPQHCCASAGLALIRQLRHSAVACPLAQQPHMEFQPQQWRPWSPVMAGHEVAPHWAGAAPFASPEHQGFDALMGGDAEAWTGDVKTTPISPPTVPQRQWSPLPMPLPPPSPPASPQLHGAPGGWGAGGLPYLSQRQYPASVVELLPGWQEPPRHMLQAQPGAGPGQQHVQQAFPGATAPTSTAAGSATCGLDPGAVLDGMAGRNGGRRVAGSGCTAHAAAAAAAASSCCSIPAIRPCVFHYISSSDADSRTAISLRQAHIPVLFPGLWRRLQAHLDAGVQVRSSCIPVTLVLTSLPKGDPGRELQVSSGRCVIRVAWALVQGGAAVTCGAGQLT